MKRPPASDHTARVLWLLKHQKLWEGMPQSKAEVWDNFEAKAKWKHIVKQMKAKGLIAPTTYWADVNLTGMINEARSILEGRAWKNYQESPK